MLFSYIIVYFCNECCMHLHIGICAVTAKTSPNHVLIALLQLTTSTRKICLCSCCHTEGGSKSRGAAFLESGLGVDVSLYRQPALCRLLRPCRPLNSERGSQCPRAANPMLSRNHDIVPKDLRTTCERPLVCRRAQEKLTRLRGFPARANRIGKLRTSFGFSGPS